MPDAFLDPLFERMSRAQRAGMRIGTLTAIDATDASVTVSLAGDSVPGVRWVGSYTPTVGDMVVVSRVEAMWIILGKLSKQLGAATVVYESMLVSPAAQWEWVPTGWVVSPGRLTQSGGAGSPNRAGAAIFALQIPSGATVLSAKLAMTRETWEFDGGGVLATPQVYGVSMGTAAPPTGTPSENMVAGYGPWRPGMLGLGDGASWDLPSSWLTAMLAGTINGVMISTTALADEMTITYATALIVAYSLPA